MFPALLCNCGIYTKHGYINRGAAVRSTGSLFLSESRLAHHPLDGGNVRLKLPLFRTSFTFFEGRTQRAKYIYLVYTYVRSAPPLRRRTAYRSACVYTYMVSKRKCFWGVFFRFFRAGETYAFYIIAFRPVRRKRCTFVWSIFSYTRRKLSYFLSLWRPSGGPPAPPRPHHVPPHLTN